MLSERTLKFLTILVIAAVVFIAPAAAVAPDSETFTLSASGHDPLLRVPIQPGAPINMIADVGPVQIGGCTLAFLFEDPEGILYISTVGHCVGAVGSRVGAATIGEFGTVTYRENALRETDFALILIDADKYEHVSPAMRFFGGPTGIQDDYTPNQLTVHHGNGAGYSTTDATRNRIGKLDFVKTEGFWGTEQHWYVATHPIIGGDSGSAILTGDGKALGWVSATSSDGGTLTGPTYHHVEARVLEPRGLSLVTAPFALAG